MTTISESTTSKFVNAGGVKLHYNEVGSGPPIICLHGAGPGATSWGNFSKNVEAFSREHRVLLVDMPQYGKSDKIELDNPRLTTLAKIMRDFMDSLGIEKADFCGNSFGGQVSLKTAIDYPERVGHVVLIGSAPVAFSLFCPMPVEGVKNIGAYYRGDGPSLAKMRTVLESLVYDTSWLTDAVVKERYEASLDPEIIKLNQLPPAPKQDLTAEFGRVQCPTLVVWGMDDRAGALDVGLLMTRAIPKAQMHIFNKCGHWAQVEHAEAFNDLVLSFYRLSA